VTELEERLARAFPDLCVAPLTELATGFHSIAVETADGVVFRIPRQEGTADGYATEDRVLPVLATRLPARIPLPEWRIEPGHRDFPWGAMGYRKLPGKHPESGSRTLAAGLGRFLTALHSLTLEVDVPPSMPLQGLPELKGVLEPNEVECVTRWWDSARHELERFEPALRHGDPWYGNLLVDESGELTGVLDWEGLAFGDPAADFAAQVYFGSAFVDAVLDHYGPVDEAFRRRVELLAQCRELGGIRISLELGDEEELAESVAKLRAGPILSR
jgi:aminoglycoside phosphotransferase (APT) family kinase protein